MVVPDKKNGEIRTVRNLLQIVERIGHGFIGLQAGHAAVNEIVEHIYDNQRAVFHLNTIFYKDSRKLRIFVRYDYF